VYEFFYQQYGNVSTFGPGMPAECCPDPGKPRGRLSYTITNEASGAKVEVLLKARAFRIVRLAILSRTGGLVFKVPKS